MSCSTGDRAMKNQGSMTSRIFVDGTLRPAAQGRTYANIGPATGAEVGRAADASPADMDEAIAAARRAFDQSDWMSDRALRVRCLGQFRAALKARADEWRRLISAET